MANTLLLKRSSVANAVPSTGNLALGELAINTFDGKLYTKIDDGSESIFELTQNQTITLSGDVSGSGISTITTVLANSGVVADTYGSASAIPSITVDAKGRITSATTFAIDTSAIANGTSNIAIPVANGNINMTVDGNTVVIITDTGANVGGTLNVTGNVAVANILTDGYFYANGAPVDFQQPAGSNTEIQFNSDGDFGASPAFTFDTAANVLTVGGNVDVSGNINADTLVGSGNVTITAGSFTTNFDDSGNVTLPGNLAVTDDVVATGNVSGGNIVTTGDVETATVTASGNVSGGNLTTAGDVTTATVTASSTITATGNVSGGNLTTAGQVAATGNVSGGNLTTAGQVAATGNVTGGNLITVGNITTVQGNISGGILAIGNNVSVTGNVTADDQIITDTVAGRTGDLTLSASSGNIVFSASGNAVDAGGARIINLGTPTVATDATTKQYVDDSVSAGLTIHTPVRL